MGNVYSIADLRRKEPEEHVSIGAGIDCEETCCKGRHTKTLATAVLKAKFFIGDTFCKSS